MTEIPDRPFDKIAIDLVTECETSTSGNKHILTIIDHLTGWPEAFPIPEKSTDTIVSTFINEYLPVHMCPWYILLDNRMEFKNNLMDQFLQQPGIDSIFSAPYHPQSNGKLEVFHIYLKPGTCQLQDNSKFSNCRNTILLSIWQRPQPPPTPTARTHATFPERPCIWYAEPGNTQISIGNSKENIR